MEEKQEKDSQESIKDLKWVFFTSYLMMGVVQATTVDWLEKYGQKQAAFLGVIYALFFLGTGFNSVNSKAETLPYWNRFTAVLGGSTAGFMMSASFQLVVFLLYSH